ncbi:MAG: FAD-dependent oxidoreductase, partial [Muribaculaceae bacterium]|nr:FAD-dependent oxidoreductase [Muribaculaceae bacterium]
MSQHYDLIVIGAGPAGYECAAIGANDGLKTLLVERDHLGGTCLNRGCIPTKTLCRSAQVAADVAHAAAYGIDTDGGWRADMAAIIERKNHIVAQLREAVDMVTAKCEKIFGTARITGPDSVEVDGQTFTASRIVVATGSEPASLPIPGAGLCVDSDT